MHRQELRSHKTVKRQRKDGCSSDINFDKRLARCIGVDIRYVLYLMDKWGHADRLLKEINAK